MISKLSCALLIDSTGRGHDVWLLSFLGEIGIAVPDIVGSSDSEHYRQGSVMMDSSPDQYLFANVCRVTTIDTEARPKIDVGPT